MRERKITLTAGEFHLREWGESGAPKLLMLHGFPEYSGAWREVAERLADRYHCIAPDQRGYGQSPAPAETQAYKAAHLVGDLAELIAALGGGPIIVVGHDWGAAAAYALAISNPQLVEKLIILNGVHPAPFQKAIAAGGAQCAASQYINYLRRPDAEARLSKDDFKGLAGLFAEHMDMSWMTPERAAQYRREWAREGRLSGMLNWYRASKIHVGPVGEVWRDLPDMPPDRLRVRMAHLLIWGAGDTALLPEATEGLEAYCDDLTRVEIAGADHWIAHQKPDEVAGAIRDWLA